MDFLNGPDVEPSAEWVAAATSREPSDRAEQALIVQRRAEDTEQRLAALRARRAVASRDDEAVGVLMAAFNVGAERAFECLMWVSQQSGTPLPDVTHQFMDRAEALGSDSHDREALLGLLSKLAGRVNASTS
nr:ANTAR domain-containing protein [Actinomycetospora corticicola]